MRCCLILLDYYLLIPFIIECNSITNIVNLTVDIVARLSVIDAIAVADIEAAPGAVPPDRVLNEPRKHRWEHRIEGAGIDPPGHGFNDVSAAAAPVAGRAIGMVGAEPVQDAGAVQKIVNEGVDGDHADADLMPQPQLSWRSDQDAGQGHGEHLVGDPVDFAQRCDESVPHAGQPVRTCRNIRRLQPLVDPANQITIGNVANKQVERIRDLVEVAVAQVMGRDWTTADVIGLGAGSAELVISTAVEVPVALQLRAR